MSEQARLPAHDDRGQVLPLLLMLTVAALLLGLGLLAAAYAEGTRWLAQRAADAAALAGAGQEVWVRQIDARGVVYCETAAVDPLRAPEAAASYWVRNTAAMPSLRTDRFLAVPQGRTLTVDAVVSAPGAALVLVGVPRLSWRVVAEAAIVPQAKTRACPGSAGP